MPGKQKLLVFGGTVFIGKTFFDLLKKQDNSYEIFCLNRGTVYWYSHVYKGTTTCGRTTPTSDTSKSTEKTRLRSSKPSSVSTKNSEYRPTTSGQQCLTFQPTSKTTSPRPPSSRDWSRSTSSYRPTPSTTTLSPESKTLSPKIFSTWLKNSQKLRRNPSLMTTDTYFSPQSEQAEVRGVS